MTNWEDGALLGDYTTRSFGEFPSVERGSHLSQILEDSPLPKYYLSAKACEGILRRAETRGKPIPETLERTLKQQSVSKSAPENPGGGKGILIQRDRTGALSTLNNQIVMTFRKQSHARSADEGQGWEETSVSDTLNIYDNGESRTPTLVVYENHSQDSRYRPLGDVCESISAKYGTGGNNQPLVVCIGNGQADLNTHITEDLAQPLNCMHDQQIIVGSEQSVRRLTPLECERLQGFPDGWTDIGEWIDSKGRARQTTDSARYKALGNSIALPFWQYLARRIVAQYEHDVTMASLFDGIGGFPLIFERSGARAVWASEIEDFPIAVTKKHFPEEAKQ